MIARRQRAKAQLAAMRHPAQATPASDKKKQRKEQDEKHSREWAKDVASKTDLTETELLTHLVRELEDIDVFKIRRLSELTQGLLNLDPKHPTRSSRAVVALAHALDPSRKSSVQARLAQAKHYATAHPDSPATQRMVACCGEVMAKEWVGLDEEVHFCYKVLAAAHNRLPSCCGRPQGPCSKRAPPRPNQPTPWP